MYKNRVKKWVGMIFLLAICIFNIDFDVYAADECSTEKAKIHYGVEYSVKYDKNNIVDSITIEVKNGEFYLKLLSRAQGKNKKPKQIAEDDSIPVINPDKPLKKNKKYKITREQLNDYIGSDGSVDFYFAGYTEGKKSSSNACAKTSYGFKFGIDGQDEAVSSGKVPSIAYNTTLCNEARALANSVVRTDTNDGRQVLSFVKNALTPCFTTMVPYNLSMGKMKEIYDNMSSFVQDYNKNAEQIMMRTDLPNLSSDWVEVEKTNMNSDRKYKSKYGSAREDMLTCNTKNEITTKRFFHIEEESHTATVVKNGVSTTGVEACKTACREQVEVTYGPPKAVVAGQCFTYEVEIKSKVVCNTSINFDNFPKYEDYAPCLLKAHCNNLTRDEDSHGGFDEQGGPNEDFDQCVASCDGGQYTQSCVNSCYDQVYGKKKTSNKKKVNNSIDNVKIYAADTLALNTSAIAKPNVKKVDNSTNVFGSCPSIAQGSVSPADIEAVYNYVNANLTGSYAMSGGALKYTPKNESCEWDIYGYAYFRDKQITARTVCNAKGLDWMVGQEQCSTMPHSSCTSKNGCYPGVKASGATYKAENGFKRATNCGEECSWINIGVDYSGRACHYVDRAQAETAYKSSIDSYTNAVQKCINKATTCVTDEETATFIMSANTDVQTGEDNQTCDAGISPNENTRFSNNKNCLKWQKDPKKNTLLDNRAAIDNATLNDDTILKFMGGSCAKESSDWIYHSIITFPGAWINNKNGEVSYNKQDQRYYKHYTGNYCTPLNGKNVNANWWLWNQYYQSKKTTKSFEEWATTNASKKLVYNIFSRIKKFGLYDWSLDVGCFYALNNQTPPPDIPPTDPDPTDDSSTIPVCTNKKCMPECVGGSCPATDTDTSFDNYTSKSISTTTMFPSSKATGTSTSTDKATVKRLNYTDKLANTQKLANSPTRAEGYNWNVEATNLSIKGYPVTPSSLVKKIESTETYVDSEIDYDITLTPTNLRTIKNSKPNYTEFSGQYTNVVNGYASKYKAASYTENSIPSYTYYKSNIIPRSGSNQYVSNVRKAPNGKGLSCNNLKDFDQCDLTLSGYVTSDSELQAFISR